MTSEPFDTERRPNVRDTTADAGVDTDTVRRRLRHRSARMERRAVEEALSTLDAHGELTAEQRQVVRLLGAALARRLTAVPDAALERVDRDGDESARTIARLFGVGHEGNPDTVNERS